MAIKNFYKILGVDYSADEASIRAAYRTLAKKYHPDLNQGDVAAAAKFRNINEAGDALLDPEKRREHDTLLESKGIDTGLGAKLLKEEEERKAREEAEAVLNIVSAEKEKEDEAALKAKKEQQKKPLTRAEKAAAAMAKVKESKRLSRRALIISLTSAAVVIVIAVSVVLGILFGGKKYELRLEYQNGTPASVNKYKEGSSIAEPERPSFEDHLFLGWFTDKTETAGEQRVAFPFELNKNVTLYARWEEHIPNFIEVGLVYNGADLGSDEPATVSVEEGSYNWFGLVPVPTRTGYIFEGWCINDTDTVIITPSKTGNTNMPWTSDVEFLTAKWTPVTVRATFSWKSGGGAVEFVEYDTAAGTVLAEDYKAQWYDESFIGFFDGDEQITNERGELLTTFKRLSALTLTARYEEP